jgi:hypothetical protein
MLGPPPASGAAGRDGVPRNGGRGTERQHPPAGPASTGSHGGSTDVQVPGSHSGLAGSPAASHGAAASWRAQAGSHRSVASVAPASGDTPATSRDSTRDTDGEAPSPSLPVAAEPLLERSTSPIPAAGPGPSSLPGNSERSGLASGHVLQASRVAAAAAHARTMPGGPAEGWPDMGLDLLRSIDSIGANPTAGAEHAPPSPAVTTHAAPDGSSQPPVAGMGGGSAGTPAGSSGGPLVAGVAAVMVIALAGWFGVLLLRESYRSKVFLALPERPG